MIQRHHMPAIHRLMAAAVCFFLSESASLAATEPPSSPAGASLTPLGTQPDWEKLASYARSTTESELRQALEAIYLEPSRYPVQWTIAPEGLKIQTGVPQKPEIVVPLARAGEPLTSPPRFWRRASELPALKNRPPLSDLHIAIDPGHIGGAYAVMEERFLSFAPGAAIHEGDLSLLTARILAERLKALGAYVTLVRQHAAPVTSKSPSDFRALAVNILRDAGFTAPADSYAGIQGEARLLTIQWQSEKLFYRVAEIHARADKVNTEIKPDVVLCLHYNAESWGDAAAPQFSEANHLHLLVNGCYSPAEIALQDTRFELFSRLLGRIHEEQIPLALELAGSLAASTGPPPYTYSTPNALPVAGSPYVYARNLLANRIYQ